MVKQLSTGRFNLRNKPEGHIFLIPVQNFLEGLRLHYHIDSSRHVKKCLELFIGSDQASIQEFMSTHDLKGPLNHTGVPFERHQKRLVAATLEAHLPEEWNETLDWMQRHIGEITDFCFSRGMAANPSDWATHLWYYITDQSPQINFVISIGELVAAAERNRELVCVGPKNRGSTLNMPFGFLQMHQSQMQFHHKHDLINTILRS